VEPQIVITRVFFWSFFNSSISNGIWEGVFDFVDDEVNRDSPAINEFEDSFFL
jgi:hypothetical protein